MKSTRFDNQLGYMIELKWFDPSTGVSCCVNCKDGVAAERSDGFICGPMEDRMMRMSSWLNEGRAIKLLYNK